MLSRNLFQSIVGRTASGTQSRGLFAGFELVSNSILAPQPTLEAMIRRNFCPGMLVQRLAETSERGRYDRLR